MEKNVFFISFVGFLHLISVLGDNLIHQNVLDKRHFQVIKPVFYHNRQARGTTHIRNGTHLQDVTLYFKAFNRDFFIDLSVNKYLFSKNFIEKKIHRNNGFSIHKPKIEQSSHCFYHGSLRGFQHSIVALSTCDGIRGLISDGRVSYHIDPSPEHGPGHHKLYIEPDDPVQRRDEKLVHSSLHANATLNYLHTRDFLHRVRRELRGPYDGNSNARFIEMYIVNDQRMYERYMRQDRQVIQRSKDIVNIVSKLYNPLNVYIALVGIEIWEQDKFEIQPQANDTLERFLNYRKYSINPKHENDNAQLITGMTFRDGVVGKAIKASICTHQYSAGVSMDSRNQLIQVATTVAHELGHNLGMAHDNYSYCQCPDDKCIMAPTQGGIAPPTKWSTCSKISLAENFEIGMDYCLRNKPEKLYDGPVCGNGFVEIGEECDCGLPEDCKTRCCDARTCRLTTGAVCATGKCCDTQACVLKPRATLCRGSYEECDLPEFCNGESEYCPADVYRKNGIECGNGQSYCLNGKCKTHTGQCRLLWGPTGRVSDPICFQHLNVNGSSTGNCGYNLPTRRYTRCDKDDVMCGLLHCVHLNEKLMFWRETLSVALPASFLTKGSKTYICRSATLDVGLNMPDPGQVPDGAKCGHEKICYNHSCTSLARIPAKECPDCNNNGVCNSIGQCHCNEGFGPPFCNEPGYGGSIHSGPIKIKDNNDLLIGLLVTFAMIIVFGCLAFLAFFYRESLKKWWINHPGGLKYRVPCFSLSSWKRPRNTSGGTAAQTRTPNTQRDISTPVFQSTTASQNQNRTIKNETSPEKVALKPQSKSKTPAHRPDPPKFFKKKEKQESSSATYQNVAVKMPPNQTRQQESSFQEVKLNPVPSETKESKSLFSKFSRKLSRSEESKPTEPVKPPSFTSTPKPIVKPGTQPIGKLPKSALKPSAPAAALKPSAPSAALKPNASAAALKPTSSSAALKPSAPSAALKPSAPNVALKPSSPATALKPAVRQNSNSSNSSPSVTRQDSNSSGSGVAMRKERVTREISNPVLISTTDRRSQAFVHEIKDGQLVPPVPAHVNRNSSSSSSSSHSPSRPKSMPLQAQKLAFLGDQNQRAAEEPPRTSPQRPPPSYESYLKSAGQPEKRSGPPNRFESGSSNSSASDDVNFPLAKNRNPIPKFGGNSKEGASGKPLLPKVKSAGYVTDQPDSNGRKVKPSRSPPKPGKKLPKKPAQASSSLEKTDSFEKVQEAPGVSHIKAMFDSMDIGKKSMFGSDNSLGQAGIKSPPVTGETRPKPSPKPGSGSKFRSVNV